ncbi:MAG: hypothetical protein K8J09_17870 [Planctomycetes bacterium]|nr:hypothetical protein [Planctomycetota bacterium]MCC7397861.1 hypothetical protein [Planctomycetota bacterium]
MSLAAAFLPLLLALAPQGGDSIFAVSRETLADGQQQVTVAADVTAVDCLLALKQLAAAVNWNVDFETTPLENDLRFATVNLFLTGQDPRMVAQLIAVAGGADCVFDAALPAEGARPTLHVVRTPSADTESGRQRLRALAGQWYRSFLRDELQYEPLVQRESVQVRMNLGEMLVESGDLDSAIVCFNDVYERRPNEFAAQAVLKVGECHLDLALAATDRQRQRSEYQQAEQWARRIFERSPTAPEVTPATILLGRALIGQAMTEAKPELVKKQAERCQTELNARVLRLLDSVEMLDVWLLTGQAQFLMERADRVQETMLTLRESPYFDDMSPRQFLDYHFLLGYGAVGQDKPELAMRALEWFLINAENDRRSGLAYVLLAESYMALGRFVQARAASVEARTRYLGTMAADWRERTLKVWARAALALGEKEKAFEELERLVLSGEEPELSLFLADQMFGDRQWQRAMAVVRPLLDRDDNIGDQARFKTVAALYEQAVASNYLDDFPKQASRIAPLIHSVDLRRRAAELIGDAYTKLNKLENAADAYRGILR